MKLLFIGGAADGQWYDVDDRARHLVVPVRRPVNYRDPWPSEDESARRHPTDTYRREQFRAGKDKWHLFILDSMTHSQAFQSLIDNYKPKKS